MATHDSKPRTAKEYRERICDHLKVVRIYAVGLKEITGDFKFVENDRSKILVALDRLDNIVKHGCIEAGQNVHIDHGRLEAVKSAEVDTQFQQFMIKVTQKPRSNRSKSK